ncbi:MAG: shikimate 5-dehydrogenase, partial [Microcystis sp.]
MTQTSETVTYSLESVLTRIESKIDTLQRDVDQKIDNLQRDVDQKIDNLQRAMDQKFDSLQKDVNDLKVEVTEIKGDIKTLDQKV